MLSSTISDGFGGFTSAFLDMLRDEFPKPTVWTTAMIEDALEWKREDTDVSISYVWTNSLAMFWEG